MIFDISGTARASGTAWINFYLRVNNWPPVENGGKPKKSFNLAYNPGERRWANGRDFRVAMLRPELLDQILAWHEINCDMVESP